MRLQGTRTHEAHLRVHPTLPRHRRGSQPRRRDDRSPPVARGIDAEMLERMARIARDLPGHTISVDNDDTFKPPPDSEPVLKIDGVLAEEILERCFDDPDEY